MTHSSRTGVFLCECGGKISRSVDLAALGRAIAANAHITWLEQSGYWCLPAEIEHLRAVVEEQKLDRVLFAGCSPRTMNAYFRQALSGSVKPTLVETLNLRDLYARRPLDDAPSALPLARDQIAMAVAELENRIAVERVAPIMRHAVVVGGGVAGLTAAEHIARSGAPVTLVERSPDLGGGAAAEISDLVSSVRRLNTVRVLTQTQVIGAHGSVGNYVLELANREAISAGAVILATGLPPNAAALAAALRVPLDADGYMAQVRQRLRPADQIERGIFVCGAAHRPCDMETATFQAQLAASYAVRHIQRREVASHSSTAAVDPHRCNGCGDCARVCPFSAISLSMRHDLSAGGQSTHLSRVAAVDSLLCSGCGNCISVCPVDAVHETGQLRNPVLAQVETVLSGPRTGPRPALILACDWSGYSAAEIAGAHDYSLPSHTRLVRVNCTGRLSPGLLLRALELGAAGILVLGCAPGHCHYEQGNEHAAQAYEQASALGRLLNMDKRLALQWVPPDDGEQFMQTVGAFAERQTHEP